MATCHPEGGSPVGVTINSLSSVSLDPPLALFCLDGRATSLKLFLQAGHFALNVLSEEQVELSNHFASASEFPDDLRIDRWKSGAPVIQDALAVADCALQDVFGGGDHQILLGRVEEVGSRESGQPLVYFDGAYCRLGSSSD